ncbi:MAG: ROK family protein [Eubacteriales bacterium]|nr:ROK family protein [Eubacteriales bacterium]
MDKYVSIDIGGTAIKYGLLDRNANILERYETATEAHKGGAAILEKTLAIVRGFREKDRLAGVCISTAGMVDVEKGEIFYAAPLIPEYAGTNFKAAIEKEFCIPCEVENDVNCAGLAESVSGAAKGTGSSLTLTIGTGIGGCIVIDGKVYHGFSNSACEVGYMHMAGSDFQTLGAASILTRKVSVLKGEDAQAWDGYAVFKAAREGDTVCCQAIDEMADILGMGIANICYVLNPEVVVLGGGIMAQEDFLKERMEAALKKYLVSGIAEKTSLKFARHRNDAGMLGAFYHFRGRHMD